MEKQQSDRKVEHILAGYVKKYRPEKYDFLCSEIDSLNKSNLLQRFKDSNPQDLCLFNYLLQACAKGTSFRENTNVSNVMDTIPDSDFKAICCCAEQLRLVCNHRQDIPADDYAAIIVPGALQKAVETRLRVICDYLQQHHFTGQLFCFGTTDRSLYPLNSLGKEREPIVFEMLSERIKRQKKLCINPEIIKTKCLKLLASFKKHHTPQECTEPAIAKYMADFFEKRYGIAYPNEFDMVQRLVQNMSFYGCRPMCVKTQKPQNQTGRTTTEEEASFVARSLQGILKNQPNANVAIVPSFFYQLLTYEKFLPSEIKLDLLSPYHGIDDYINRSIRNRVQVDPNNEQSVRKAAVNEIFDVFSRYIYSLRALSPVFTKKKVPLTACAKIISTFKSNS